MVRKKLWAGLLVVLTVSPVFSQTNPLIERLLKNRYSLTVADGKFVGTAAPVLEAALAESQYVLVGEEHGIQQVPQFVSGVCTFLGPQGLHTLAVETGPLMGARLEKWARDPGGLAKLTDFEKRYPESIAFFNMREEFDLLSHCAQVSGGGEFHLWGLDQELMGASTYLLNRMLETHPGPVSTAAINSAFRADAAARAKANETGNPMDLYMITARDEDLARLKSVLQTDGNHTSLQALNELTQSREIYQKNSSQGFASNRQRALLMKSNFFADLHTASRAEGKAPKVLFKFGDWHVYKGMNPLRNNDLGNFVTEWADAQDTTSLHIVVLGVKGSHLRFAGAGRPYQAQEFKLLEDDDYRFLQPLVDNLESSEWTMFDLRGLRAGFRGLGPIDANLDRLIFGCDLLILAPEATASRQAQ